MYERSAIVLERYFDKIFGENKENNLKTNYGNYTRIIEELKEYQRIIEEEEKVIEQFDQIANEIRSIQQEMLEFVKVKEKSQIRGNLNTLIDVLNNYKFNCDNEKYKNNKHILVQDIKRNSEQSILLYRDLIQTMLSKKELMHSRQKIKFA